MGRNKIYKKNYMMVSSGFTLVELMVVVAIIALVAGFTFAELNTSSYRLKTAARTLMANMQKARLLAVKNSCPVYVDFDFDDKDGVDKGYTLWRDLNDNGTYDDTTTDNNNDGVVDKNDEEEVGTVSLVKGVSWGAVPNSDGGPAGSITGKSLPSDGVSYDNDRCKFTPQGTSLSGAVYLYDKSNSGAGTAVIITNNIGRVRDAFWTTHGGKWRQ
jgi:prepilin-type N-terminal cleavage/methylation domain-containing protein